MSIPETYDWLLRVRRDDSNAVNYGASDPGKDDAGKPKAPASP